MTIIQGGVKSGIYIYGVKMDIYIDNIHVNQGWGGKSGLEGVKVA